MQISRVHGFKQPYEGESHSKRASMTKVPTSLLQIRNPRPAMKAQTAARSSVFQLAKEVQTAQFENNGQFEGLTRLLDMRLGHASCKGTPQLTKKFGVAEDNLQTVVVVTENYGNCQVWWNEERTKKPQTFQSATEPLPNSTNNGQNCDFCNWQALTASDTFGRIENESCVTASNLFKFAYPCHGLILFKHHQPLQFTATQMKHLLEASHLWFQKAAEANPHGHCPMLVWNCLPRAGASQYHGHAQVTLTEVLTPEARLFQEAQNKYRADGGEGPYVEALVEAHRGVGLARTMTHDKDRAECFVSLAPRKDMEVFVLGESLTSTAFAQLLHSCLRGLIDQLGVTSFNVGILNIGLSADTGSHGAPVVARMVSRGPISSRASDFGGLEVFGGASIGHTDPYAIIQALDAQLGSVPGFAAGRNQ